MVISRCVPENGRSGPSRGASKPSRKGNRFAKKLAASSWRSTVLLATAAFAGCSSHSIGSHESQSLTPAGEAAVREGVQGFMQRVADDVTREGPLAWRKYLDRSPAFFMAVNGQMAFPNGAAAQEGTQKFAQTINHIELKWGNDLRVDPLTAELAVVAVSWSEVQLDTKGHRVDEAGYFTGLAEYREEHWQLRDAHWSSSVPTRRGD
jgi:hypothetical protein